MTEQERKILDWINVGQYMGIPYNPENSGTQLNAKILNWFEQLRAEGVTAIRAKEFKSMPEFAYNEYAFSNASNASTYYKAFLQVNPTVGVTYVDYIRPLFTLQNPQLANLSADIQHVVPEIGKIDEKVLESIEKAIEARKLPTGSAVCSYFTFLGFTKALLMELCGVNIKTYKSLLVAEMDRNIIGCGNLKGAVAHYAKSYISTSSFTAYYEPFKKIVLERIDNMIIEGKDVNAEIQAVWEEFAIDFMDFVPEPFVKYVENSYATSYLAKAVEIYTAIA